MEAIMLYEADSVTDTVVVARPGYSGDLATVRVSSLELGPRLGRKTLAELVHVTWPAPRPPRGEDPNPAQQRAVVAAMLEHMTAALQTKLVKAEKEQLERARVNLERYIAAHEP
jgi:hypothetical protein